MPSSHWHFLCWARFTILAQEAAAKAAGLVAYARGAGPAQGKLPASPPLEADDLLRVWVAITTETGNNSDTRQRMATGSAEFAPVARAGREAGTLTPRLGGP